MLPHGKPAKAADRKEQALAQLVRERQLRESGYRERALKIHPHVCARCGREFSGKRLRELTVHHKDHDYKNNPPDGSNWELLCLYCHDHEHEGLRLVDYCDGPVSEDKTPAPSIFAPFADLDTLMRTKESGSGSEPKPEP
jgi:hypothetical protein